MPDTPLLIYHHLPKSGGTSLLAVMRENYEPSEVAELYGDVAELHSESAESGKLADEGGWYGAWYESLTVEERGRIRCVASHTANQLMPALEQPFRAFCMLRDPVEHVWSLYHFLRRLGRQEGSRGRGAESGREFERRGWDLADLYRELGGGGPRSSALHDRFRGFFNGQARSILAPWRNPSKLEYWAGVPDRGAALRDRAHEILDRHYVVGVKEQFDRSLKRFAVAFKWDRLSASHLNRSEPRGRPDPETRSLILAHNQIDAELHAHFFGAVERDRPRPRPRAPRTSQRSGAVCVLGAPRSGTSLTARILNVLGVDLGPEDELMDAAAGNNRTGFWEHEGIANLNEDILASLSESPPPYLQGWRWPPPLPEGWQRDATLEPHRRAARTILRRSFGEGSPWGWKDPRTTLTLPFWQELVPEMRYVICVRHPLDVAASLAERDEMATEESLRLWSRYMADAINHTRGLPRLFVSYESYFPDWEGQARRLATFLGLADLGEERCNAIAAHIDGSLWHHRGVKEGVAGLPGECASLYAELSELARA